MAVDFSTRATDVDSQIAPSAAPLNPVSRQGEIDALNTIGQGIAKGAQTVGTIFRNNAAAGANKYLADFSLKLNALQDAQDQGLSAQEVRTRSRALLSTSLANNPNAEEDILKRYSTWLNQSGVDKIATPDIQRYQIQQKQTEAAVSAGFLSADKVGDPQAEEKAVGNLENFQRQTTQLELDAKKVNAESSRLDLSAKQKEAIKTEGEKTVLDGLAKVGSAALPYWRTQYENIKAAASKAGSEQERQQIIKDGIVQLNTDYAQRTAALAGDGLATNQAKIDQILKPQRDLIDTYIKELDGTYNTEMFKRMSDGAMARAETAALGKLSDKALEWLTLSKSSQGLSAVLAEPIQREIVEAYAKNAQAAEESGNTGVGNNQLTPSPNRAKPVDPLPSDDSQTKTVKDYLNSVTTLIEKGSSDGMLAEDKVQLDKEIDGQMKSIFRGVNVYSNSVESAKEFQPIIDFLSNPTIGQYLQERGGIPTSIRGETAKVIQDGYDKQVIPLLQTELATLYNDKPGSGIGQRMTPAELRPASELVEPSFENNRFGFKLKEGIETNRFNDLLLKKMNNSAFSKVFNKMVIANSHIQGNTDYQKSYDTLAPEVFQTTNTTGGPDERSQNTNNTLNGLTEEDAMIQPASFIPAEDNPNIDAAVLQRFEGKRLPVSLRNNNMGAISITGDIASSWAALQPGFVGVSKRPKAEGGYYAAYATPEDGVAAASNLLIRYGEKGTNTPSKIVKKWSADTNAHTAYAKTLVKFLNAAGFDVDTSTTLDLSDPDVRMAILKAKSAHESGAGKQVYSDSVFQKGVLGESV